MYGINDAPKGSPKATINLNVTDNSLEEIKHRAAVQMLSIDDFVRTAGYINPAIHTIQYLLQIGDLEGTPVGKDIELLSDKKSKAQLSKYYEDFGQFIGQKYTNVFFECTQSGKYTSDKLLAGTRHHLQISTTLWDKENIECFANLLRISLNEYLLFATTYDLAYIQPLNLDTGISYLNQMLEAAKLIDDAKLRKTLKKDILDLRNYLKLLCEHNTQFYLK